jgi:hypothetical protein
MQPVNVEHWLAILTRNGVSMLHADEATWEELSYNRHMGRRFSTVYPHLVARAARPSSFAIVSAENAGSGLFVALVRSILKVSTLESRVVFDLVRPISPGALSELLDGEEEATPIEQAAVRVAAEGRHEFHTVPAVLGRKLVRGVVERVENVAALQPILDYIDRPARYRNARALQDDAVQMALKVFGADVTGGTLSLTGRDTALTRAGLQENLAVNHDARWIPGWRLEDSDLTGRAVFRSEADQLTIFTANHEALEELFGVDLIYLNERRGSILMVQYKMMEPSAVRPARSHSRMSREKEWIVPVNAHLLDQIARMSRFDRDLAPAGPYRLNSGAFYFKFVKRDASRRTAGIMISLEHLQQLLDEGARGPRDGLRVSYHELDGHYLRGEPFADLVRSGYIGSRGATTEHLRALIDRALQEGRAAVAAINSVLPR